MTRFALWLLLAALLQACGGGGGGPAPAAGGGTAQSCSVQDQRDTVLSFMQDEYYWYPQLRTPDASASSMDAWFQSMLYKPTDRFSFTQTTTSFDQLFDEGTFTGYGYTLTVTSNPSALLRVRSVEPQGPAYAAGLRRGDTVLSIDGASALQVINGSAGGGVSTDGVPRTMRVRTVAGVEKDIAMTSATFPLTPVRDVTVLGATRNGQPVKVGYLGYSQFVTYSLGDLQAAIQSFAQQGVSELVLDLRYNGGGDVATSRDLASLVAGARVAGQLFAALRYNDKNQARNFDYNFAAPVTSTPALSRVFVIASGSTASASELLVNGLTPFMPVVLVGETTYGKPYGFEPFSYCGITYNAVNFEVFNSAGVGGYTSGLAPTCAVADDLDHALGDPNEGRLKAALGYIATGQCPQAPQAAPLVTKQAPATIGDSPAAGMYRR
jgi:C-terminal processing protease CtpA/Prc